MPPYIQLDCTACISKKWQNTYQHISLYGLASTLYKAQVYTPKDPNVGLKHRDNHITVERDVPQHQLHSVLKLLEVPQHLHTCAHTALTSADHLINSAHASTHSAIHLTVVQITRRSVAKAALG